MNVLRWTLAGMIAVVATAQIGAVEKAEKADNAKLIIGKWEITKSGGGAPPVGAVIEFTKEGKGKITIKVGDKEESHEGEYKVVDDTVQFLKDGEKKDAVTIKKISDKELILEGKDKEKVELKRLP